MKARFTDERIIGMIKEQESGEKTADVCRRHGISSATFDKYKSKYGGMEPSDAKRLRALEDENGKLKNLLAEQMLDNAMLRDCLNETLFGTLGDARKTLEEWQEDYNWRRPHLALGNLTPMEFLQRKEMDKMAA
jgi:putative transposase